MLTSERSRVAKRRRRLRSMVLATAGQVSRLTVSIPLASNPGTACMHAPTLSVPAQLKDVRKQKSDLTMSMQLYKPLNGTVWSRHVVYAMSAKHICVSVLIGNAA